MHFSERQGSIHSKSGIMLDYDIITSNKNPILTDRHYNRIAISIIMALYKDINFAEQYGKYFKSVEAKLHVIFIIKKEALPIAETLNYKYGLHILIPGIKLSRTYKKWFIYNDIIKEHALLALNKQCKLKLIYVDIRMAKRYDDIRKKYIKYKTKYIILKNQYV